MALTAMALHPHTNELNGCGPCNHEIPAQVCWLGGDELLVCILRVVKNTVFTLVQFWFNLYTAYSGQRFYDDWLQAFYNLLFTSLPVIALGLLDQDVSKVPPPLSVAARHTSPKVQWL